MDQGTILLIIWLSAAIILAAIVSILIGYKFRLDYLKSKDDDDKLENSEEDVNTIIAHVIDKELDRRLAELGLIRPASHNRNEPDPQVLYEGSEDSRDKFKKLLRDIGTRGYYDEEEPDWR